jgi:hypothetical protein
MAGPKNLPYKTPSSSSQFVKTWAPSPIYIGHPPLPRSKKRKNHYQCQRNGGNTCNDGGNPSAQYNYHKTKHIYTTHTWTNHPCPFCELYGNPSHHCLELTLELIQAIRLECTKHNQLSCYPYTTLTFPLPQHAPITPSDEVPFTLTSFFTPHMVNPPSHPIYLTTDAQSCRLWGTPSTSSTTMSIIPYPCQENGSLHPHPSHAITFYWDKLIQERILSSTLFRIQVIVNTFIVYLCIIDNGASSCIISSSTWKQIGSPTLIPSMTELRAFDGRIISPLGILPNLPIELGGKMVLINVVVMDSLVDYNILLGHDFIYVMSFVVSSLLRFMIFQHEGCTITINHLSYNNPHPRGFS